MVYATKKYQFKFQLAKTLITKQLGELAVVVCVLCAPVGLKIFVSAPHTDRHCSACVLCAPYIYIYII